MGRYTYDLKFFHRDGELEIMELNSLNTAFEYLELYRDELSIEMYEEIRIERYDWQDKKSVTLKRWVMPKVA